MNTAKNVYPITGAIMTDNQLSIAGIEQLPDPLTPADADLKGFDRMWLNTSRLFRSELWARSTGEEFKAALKLWGESMLEKPAGSLPDDDVLLARLADYGRDLKGFGEVKTMALHGWFKCSDGRLYHHVVAETVAEAWAERLKFKEKQQKERDRKQAYRDSLQGRNSDNDGHDNYVPRDNNGTTTGHDAEILSKNGNKNGNKNGIDINTPYSPPSENPEEPKQEPKPKATGKQSPKKDGVKLTQAWIDENTEAMKQVYFTKMRENELKATEQRWSYIRGDFVEHWINSATNSDKFKKIKWLDTWLSQVEKQINYNKLKWKAEESGRNAGNQPAKSRLGSLDDDYLKDADWDRIFKGEG